MAEARTPTVLITGSSRGLGLEFARQYAAAGWRVHAACRKPRAAAGLGRIKGDIAVHKLDVTDGAMVAALAERIAEPIDILVNNAGIYGPARQDYGDIDYAGWAETFAVNAMAPLRVAQAFAGHVARSDRRLIANLTSQMGSIADNTSGGDYAYRSSKAALNMVMRSLATDLRRKRITVIVVHPGWVRTDMGGRGAPLAAKDSVATMRQLFDSVGPAESGSFLSYDGGRVDW